jgi:folylpolyglutamate synthase/dihydropteroate synthase
VPAAARRPGDSGGVTLYADGAHTERSIRHCLAWFTHASAHCAAAASGGAPPRRVLVFYCGHEKDVLQLLLPLSTARWDKVYITTVPWARPSRMGYPTAAGALASYLQKKERMQDTQAIADIRAGAEQAGLSLAALTAAGGDSTSGSAAVGQVPTPDLRWQATLAELWAAVHTRPEFARLRSRLAQPVGEYVSSPAAGGGDAEVAHPVAVAQTVALPAEPPPTVVVGSIAEVLAQVQREAADAACRPGSPPNASTHVLATGSLYLVGGVLEAAGWREGQPSEKDA